MGFLLLLLAALGITTLKAQPDPSGVQELNNQIARSGATVLDVFSSANTISAGDFHFDNPGPDDVDFSTFKLPADYKFGDETNHFRPFVEGYYGYFKLNEDVTGLGPPKGEFSIRGYTFSAGGGVEWKVCNWLYLAPRLMLAYSHLWQDYNRDVPPTDPTANLIDNWHADILTVSPSLEARGAWTVGRWDFQVRSRYTFLQLYDLHNNSSYINLDSSSQVWENQAEVSYRAPWAILHFPLRPFAQFARYDLAGDITEIDFVDFFYEARAGIGITLPHALKPLREVVISGAYYWEGPLTGYSIGLSLKF